MEPDYAEWLQKPAWSIQETLYLISRLDPAYTPQNRGLSVDLDTDEITPVEPDKAVIQNVVKAAVEMGRRGIPDLIDRAIKAGELKPTDASGEYFRSHEMLTYLVNRGVSLPAQITGAFNEPFLINALKHWFSSPLERLPADVRARIDRDFSPMPWDDLSPDQRRSVAAQWDYQHDPATEEEREFWWEFARRQRAIEKQIAEWNAVATPTASDLAQKEARLAELDKELARMKQQQGHARGDYHLEQKRLDAAETESSSTQNPSARYIAYPKAMALLTKRLGATTEELAAWVFIWPLDGGLAAYTNANELDPPPRFHFDYPMGEDYISPLMACWFREDEIERFVPTDHYITGKALIERWSKLPSIQPEAFIRAKIVESRLQDIHPIYGVTQGTNPQDASSPPLAIALFALSQVEEIEDEDFGKEDDVQSESVASPCKPVSAGQIRNNFAIEKDGDANDRWWKKQMRDAKRNGLEKCRVGEGKKGRRGSLWRPDLIAAWLVDRHAKARKGLNPGAARWALKKFPGCEDAAEYLLPADK